MFKNFPIVLDITESHLNDMFQVNNNDLNTIKLSMTVKSGMSIFNLTGKTVRIAVKKPDGLIAFQTGGVIDPENGLCEFILDRQAYLVEGKHEAEVMIYQDDSTVIVTERFYYQVNRAIMNDKTLISTNHFPAINQAIQAGEALEGVDLELIVEANERVTGIQAQVDELVLNGDSSVEAAQARVDAENVAHETLKARADSDYDKAKNKTSNLIGFMEYQSLKVVAGQGYDWSPVFNKAFEKAKAIGGQVVMPFGVFDHYSSVLVPENTNMIGAGNSPNGTVLNYKGSGGWAIKTSGLHQRNIISNIRIELNGNGNGIMLGEYGDALDLIGRTIPIQFTLNHIVVSGIGSSYTGISILNASHYTLQDVRIGFGTTSGRGLFIYADGFPNGSGGRDAVNAGVGTFVDCSLGRVDANDIGMEIDGIQNLDTFTFMGCYFGGKTPIKVGKNTFVRNFNIFGGHAEGRNTGGTVNIMELYNLLGGNVVGFTFAGFGAANTNGIAFKGTIEALNVDGCEANGMMGTIFLNDGSTLIEGCDLQYARLTNSATAAQFNTGFPEKNFKRYARYVSHENIRVKYLLSIDGVNKEYWAATPDATLGHSRGDIVKNTTPSRMKNISEWKCITTGTPGVFQAIGSGYGTTAERPTLNVNDAGYIYFDTTLFKRLFWNGSAWLETELYLKSPDGSQWKITIGNDGALTTTKL